MNIHQAFNSLAQSMEDIFSKREDTSSAHEKALLMSKFSDPNTLAKGIEIRYACRVLLSSDPASIKFKMEERAGTMFTDGKAFMIVNTADSLVSFRVYANGMPADVNTGWGTNKPIAWWYPDQPKPNLGKLGVLI